MYRPENRQSRLIIERKKRRVSKESTDFLTLDLNQVVEIESEFAILSEIPYTVRDSQLLHRSIRLLCPQLGTPPSPNVTLANREIFALKGASHEHLCRQFGL